MEEVLTATIARAWWERDRDAFDVVYDLTTYHSEAAGAVIRMLAETAPDGALSYIGVAILEDLSMDADYENGPDTTLDRLFDARLEPAVMFEILAGPYPEFLEKWDVRERFLDIFTPAQMDALYDWPTHRDHRLVLDGEGFRIEEQSAWFDN
jgi:hypothetical protein